MTAGEWEDVAAMVRADFERECQDADRLLVALGFDQQTGRTEGGSLRVARIVERIDELRAIENRHDATDTCLAMFWVAVAVLLAAKLLG